MKLTLPAAHLFRHYMLFVITVLCLLTFGRAAYALWKFVELEQTGAFVPLFVQGLRFDLALIGLVCLIPIFIGSLLSMFAITRGLSKFIITLFLYGALLAILLLELVTPWFIHTVGVRPDPAMLLALPESVDNLVALVKEQWIVAALMSVLFLLVLVAFWRRMELQRFLRYRTSIVAGILCSIVGTVLCLLAIWSNPDPRKLPLGPADALISVDTTVNELALNSTYKMLHSVALPFFNSLSDTAEKP